MKLLPFAFYSLLLLSISSCANYKLNYASDSQNWQKEVIEPTSELSYTLYLIGDIGDSRSSRKQSGLDLLTHQLKGNSEETGIVFLGNQLSISGQAKRSKWFETSLKNQLDKIKEFPGDLFFVAGEKDWNAHGLEGVEWQKEIIENYLGREDIWFPKPGCSGPEVVELTKDVVLLLVDSEWYLRDWDGESDINNDCGVKSRAVFRWLTNNEMKSNRHKNTVVAMHHSLVSYGPHGGSHPLKEHIFPLTAINDNLYLPLPIIGSLSIYLRSSIGNRRDIVHPVYQEFVDAFRGPAKQNGRYIFAGAHDQSLQHIERDSQVYIVSGAGSSRTTPSHAGEDAQFAYSRPGFSRINFYEDGSAWVEYWASVDDDDQGELVFKKQIKAPFPELVDPPTPSFDPIAPGETIKVPISERDYDKGSFWRFLFGEHYRDVYNAEIEVPLFDLTQFKGGVTPIKRGGGSQTNSLRIQDDKERQYTLRSVDKDATRTVPYPFNRDVIISIVEDNFSASHPFGALSVAELSKSLGIYHTNPMLVYLPKQAALGKYNEDYAEALYLLEEHPNNEVWQEADYFGNPNKIESTEDMLEELRENPDHILDDEALLYARLFDMVLGDWDRHDDQWRWGITEQDSMKVYHPIPRDRDQVFGHYDGFAGLLIRQMAANAKQFKPFRTKIKNTKWENYNGRYLDQSLLTSLEWAQWENAVNRLQETMTDQRIEDAFKKTWPKHIYQINGSQITQKLKSRRDQLMKAARERYLFLAKQIVIVGTDGRDLFEIEQLNREELKVRVYDTNSEREKELLYYERTFHTKETNELNIYGLADEDVFVVTGTGRGGPKLNLIGGIGKDVYENHHQDLPIHIYDTKEEASEIKDKGKLIPHLNDDPFYNLYNRRSPTYEYDFGGYFPSLAYNPEDGLFWGLTARYITYGFKRIPFATKHKLNLGYAWKTSGLRLDYEGIFTDVLRRWDLEVIVAGQTPLYTKNFYGLGNHTVDQVRTEGRDPIYYQLRLAKLGVYPALLRTYNSGAKLSLSPIIEYFQLDRTPERYIGSIVESLPEDIFGGRWYGGVRATYDYRNQDNAIKPSRGFAIKAQIGWKGQIEHTNQEFPFFSSAFTFYQKVEPKGRIVFATRLGFDHIFNDKFEFYQGVSIGGSGPNANFRGLIRDRYTGQTAFYQNTDLRVRILHSSEWGLPITFGILGGFDHGRIWVDNDSIADQKWHQSYGAGIWISPINIFLINLSIFQDEEKENRFTLSGSFFF